MSAAQWGAMIEADESYAGARSFFQFEETVRSIFGHRHVIPAHQGRAAERLLCRAVVGEGSIVPGNTHFDTTRANIEVAGAEAVDLPTPEADDLQSAYPFKGNIDLGALEELLGRTPHGRVPFVLVTVTNNSSGGQPVSMENLEGTRALCDRFGVPLLLDAARFAENAFFIKSREPGWRGIEVTDEQLPGWSLTTAIYEELGVRACEIGNVMFGQPRDDGSGWVWPRHDLVRLAVPRRVYTKSQIDFVSEGIAELYAVRAGIPGLRFVERPAVLPHFRARFERLEETAASHPLPPPAG